MMLTDEELIDIFHAWGNERTQRSIVDLCRDVARSQEAAERDRWAERDDMHTESSRIYARLASAVRAGADDATLARLLRSEVASRA
jgi:hypothetical protein